MGRGLLLGERVRAGIIDVEPPGIADVHRGRAARVCEALHAVGEASALAIGDGRLDGDREFGRRRNAPQSTAS